MRRNVMTCSLGTDELISFQERVRHADVARLIARLLGGAFVGEYAGAEPGADALYLVPHKTIVGLDLARRLGMAGSGDLFGGVVPFPFVATKAISHPLVGPEAAAPAGWSAHFSQAIRGTVLPGYTAFSRADAYRAAATLLREGPVRLKNTLAAGGGGQTVIRTVQELDSVLGEIAPPQLEGYGLVFERDLVDATTNSVGQVRIGRCVASYYGTQQLTVNNRGRYCYGGSDLVVIRGGYRQLLELDLCEPMRLAVTQAMTYDRAVGEHYPEAILSRRNYDVIQGWDQHGRWHSGVLEQSWRIGGASGPEVAAMLAFKADPSLHVVRAASVERYGDGVARPVDCHLHFDGIDPVEGRMQSYTEISACERRLPSRNRSVARGRQRQLAPLVGR